MRKFVVFAVINCLLLFFFSATSVLSLPARAESRRYHGAGKLTAHGEGTALINEQGYNLDASVLVVDLRGRPVPLSGLSLPAYVAFDYVYTQTAARTMSPVIVYLKQTRQSAGGRGGRMR